MNLRNVLKVYGLQRQFSDDESALLKTLQSLNDTERDLLVESLSSAQKKSSKKSATSAREYDHCLQCGTTKRDSSHKNQSSPDYHEFQSSKNIDFCARCKGASEVHPIHHEKQFGGYHPFESSKKSAGKGAGKSQRASGMAAQLNKSLQPQRQVTDGNGLVDKVLFPTGYSEPDIYDAVAERREQRCTAMVDDNGGQIECGEPVDNNIHHKQTDPDYHEFQPAQSAAVSGG